MVIREMKNNEKCDVADDSSSFSCLPDEMVLQILNKLVDFKTLCLCKLVSKRVMRIVHQVDTISFTSFTHPLADPPTEKLIPTGSPPSLGSYWSAMNDLANFGRLKSLRIQIPSSFDDNHLLFKCMIKFGIQVDSFVFLSPNSVFANKELYVNANGREEEKEDVELFCKKLDIACECLKDVGFKFFLLMQLITSLPFLQDVSITDPDQKVRVSLNGEKVSEMRNSCEAGELKKQDVSITDPDQKVRVPINREKVAEMRSIFEAVGMDKHAEDLPFRISMCCVPLLKLPVSGYIMQGVTVLMAGKNDFLDDDIDSFMKIDLNAFEDKEEAAYHEAVIEIVKNHMSRIARFT